MRNSELLPAMLEYCQYDVLFSACRRAAVAFRGPWAGTISDSKCGKRFAAVQCASAVVSSVHLPAGR
eukprot:8914518-Pyramimonas_sp.AAC.1